MFSTYFSVKIYTADDLLSAQDASLYELSKTIGLMFKDLLIGLIIISGFQIILL